MLAFLQAFVCQPNEAEVRDFESCVSEKVGLALRDDEAQHYCTNIARLCCVPHYDIHSLCPDDYAASPSLGSSSSKDPFVKAQIPLLLTVFGT